MQKAWRLLLVFVDSPSKGKDVLHFLAHVLPSACMLLSIHFTFSSTPLIVSYVIFCSMKKVGNCEYCGDLSVLLVSFP